MNSSLSHSISPGKVIRGENAWNEAKHFIPAICNSPLLLGRSQSTAGLRDYLLESLQCLGIKPIKEELKYDCCEFDLNRLKSEATNKGCDAIIAAGGGKVLDSGKLLANRLGIPCVTVPLSAATCAGWTALSNIYSPEGAFEKDELLKSCPNLLIFDETFIRNAPRRTLASGIADALAKWYEASLTSSSSTDALVQQAVQLARVLRDQLLIDGHEAFSNSHSEAWTRVSQGCGLTAGLIGGIGGARCRTATAHCLHNGLTQLKSAPKALHGEIVGFGILVQLRLEEIITGNQLARVSRDQLLPFLRGIKLPVSLKELGLGQTTLDELHEACDFACNNSSEMRYLPFDVTSNNLLNAVLSAGEEGESIKQEPGKTLFQEY